MQLEARKAIKSAADGFVQEISAIFEAAATKQGQRIASDIQALLNGGRAVGRKVNGTSSRGRKPGRPPRSKAFKATDAMFARLTSYVARQGGEVAPHEVSALFDLDPDQRRRLVGAAVERGLLKTKGSRRSTTYVLAAKRAGAKKTKRGKAKKRGRRKGKGNSKKS